MGDLAQDAWERGIIEAWALLVMAVVRDHVDAGEPERARTLLQKLSDGLSAVVQHEGLREVLHHHLASVRSAFPELG